MIHSLLSMSATVCLILVQAVAASAGQPEKLAPGVWKLTFGIPEKHRPADIKYPAAVEALENLPAEQAVPALLEKITFKKMPQGVLAALEMDDSERIYGFGMQVNTFGQRGLRREIRTSSGARGNDRSYPHPVPLGDIGMGHAPMPFYISSKGYGLLINTSRYVTFYVGSQHKIGQSVTIKNSLNEQERNSAASAKELYQQKYTKSADLSILTQGTEGVEVILFEGPSMMDVIRRYNLFSGGGAIPPLWGLGFKYRGKSDFTDEKVLSFARYFRDNRIPCDMIGLEPGWHSSAYSCSYVWNRKNFPKPDSLLQLLHGADYKLNLWEHAYVHPSSPLFDPLIPFSGNYAVWQGAVPDFLMPRARQIFGDYHRKNFLDKAISAFKLDECDAAYYDVAGGEWSFPDIAEFPSGLDGVQMRQLFGFLYQKVLWDEFRKAGKRTMLEARASYLFAAPFGSAIYSDLYDHTQYVNMIANSGFCGLNWSPEVRETRSEADLIRRLQTTLMSAHMVVDCWFLENLPWFQFDRDKNNRGEFLPHYRELEQKVKKLAELRMSLIPYLYAAFARYHAEGIPPFRALVLDYPDDPATWQLSTQYMMGPDILCAPFLDGASEREIYLPEGNWYDFNTNKKYEGAKKHTIRMNLDEIPMFVREGTILPLARPVQFITQQTVFDITCRTYGKNLRETVLFEDDGFTFGFEGGQYNRISLEWNGRRETVKREGSFREKKYRIISWEHIN